MSLLARRVMRQQSHFIAGVVTAPIRRTSRVASSTGKNSHGARNYTTSPALGAENSSSSSGGSNGSKDSKAPQPKILNVEPPKEEDASEEVKAHNRDFERRADRPQAKVTDEDVAKEKGSK